jgi:hypothetical protein
MTTPYGQLTDSFKVKDGGCSTEADEIVPVVIANND